MASPSLGLVPIFPCIAVTLAPTQEQASSLPSPASLDALTEHVFDGPEHLPLFHLLLPSFGRVTRPLKEPRPSWYHLQLDQPIHVALPPQPEALLMTP